MQAAEIVKVCEMSKWLNEMSSQNLYQVMKDKGLKVLGP